MCDYGAVGIAVPSETVELRARSGNVWWFSPGTQATIYHSRDPQLPCDSVGIQAAIDAAHRQGGGIVLVPAGDYLIGPIRLRSRVHLHLEPGASLGFTVIGRLRDQFRYFAENHTRSGFWPQFH